MVKTALEQFVGGVKEGHDHAVGGSHCYTRNQKKGKKGKKTHKGGAVGYTFNLADDVSSHGEAAVVGYDNRAPEGNPYFITGGSNCYSKGGMRHGKKHGHKTAKKSMKRSRKTKKTMKRSRK